MVDRIVPFRPRRDRDESESYQARMERLEHLEELLELMREHGVESRLDLERQIQELEAALDDDNPHGPNV
jgi:hypothetical protein